MTFLAWRRPSVTGALLLSIALSGHDGLAQDEAPKKQTENKRPGAKKAPNSRARSPIWTCPMHPQIQTLDDAKCPICSMQLVPVASPARSPLWTCPLHPQIRRAGDGKCPICAMELAPITVRGDLTKLNLQQMLAIALEHSPDVRAATAKIQLAKAELDRSRLEVVQRVSAFREKLQAQRLAVKAAEQEVAAAQQATNPSSKLATAAKEALAAQRARLADIEAQLPFLLGHAHIATNAAGATSRELIKSDLLPKARLVLELRGREYTTGEGSIRELADAHRQILELEFRVAESPRRKAEVLRSQRKLLQDLRKVAEAKYRAGQAPQGDVLAIEMELSKLDLRMIGLTGD